MTLNWIIFTLAVVVCAVKVIAGDNVRHCNLMRRTITLEEFERYLRNVYKSWDKTSLECARLCSRDEQCNGALVCPGVCHLFGVLRVSSPPVKGADYKTCDAFMMNRCKNNGFPDDNGYCTCPRGYGGPFCETAVHGACYNQWQLSFINDANLRQFQITSGKSLEVKMKYVIDGRKINLVQNSGNESDTAWAQTTYELSKSSWNTFDDSPNRLFRIIRNGKYQNLMIFDINGSPITLSSLSVINAKWYVKTLTQEDMCCSEDEELGLKVTRGSAVPSLSSLFVRRDREAIVGESTTSVGNAYTSPHLTYILPPYWYMERYSTTGSVYIFRWFIGRGGNFSESSRQLNQSLCTDDCWVKMLGVDESGKTLQGSAIGLARALLSGHQLRIYTRSVASATKAIYIHGQTVTACLEDMMQPVAAKKFGTHGTAQRKMASSNGRVQIRRYTFESNAIIEELQKQQTIHWFVDTREWIQVISVGKNGQILSGSVTYLREKVLKGATVRIVVEFTSAGVYQIVHANHLEVSPSGDVAADVIYHSNIQFGDYLNISFPPASSHHLWSAIITTEGEYRRYLYTYKRINGQHETVSPNVEKYTWFIQL